jgi:hypothetical protein
MFRSMPIKPTRISQGNPNRKSVHRDKYLLKSQKQNPA